MRAAADRRRKPGTALLGVAVVLSIGVAIGGWMLLNQSHTAPDGTRCGSRYAGFEGGTYVDDGRVLRCSDLPVFSYRWGWPVFLGGIVLSLLALTVLAVRSQRDPLT
jgi:hypothetical protein